MATHGDPVSALDEICQCCQERQHVAIALQHNRIIIADQSCWGIRGVVGYIVILSSECSSGLTALPQGQCKLILCASCYRKGNLSMLLPRHCLDCCGSNIQMPSSRVGWAVARTLLRTFLQDFILQLTRAASCHAAAIDMQKIGVFMRRCFRCNNVCRWQLPALPHWDSQRRNVGCTLQLVFTGQICNWQTVRHNCV